MKCDVCFSRVGVRATSLQPRQNKISRSQMAGFSGTVVVEQKDLLMDIGKVVVVASHLKLLAD
jgi:hypothetical protein